jgi:transcriptional regulator with XRE-family HTH domain
VTHRKDRLAEAEKFGAIVRALREKRGFTQEQLAERADVSPTYIGFVERGDNVPTLIIILQIASALGVPPADLLRDF